MTEQNTQPMFFQEPVPIMPERHADAGISQEADYKFARETNSLPVTMQEFPEACKTYAIAFANDGSSTPVVILGFRANDNLFVDKFGIWLRNTYIPAYARRYPFAFTAQNDKLILCVDEKSARFVKKAKKTDLKFFEGKNDQSALIKNALAFCQQFHFDTIATAEFGNALRAQGLLTDQRATFNIQGEKEPVTLSGFSVVDIEKFMNLPADILQKWHKNGYLALVNLHLLSLSNIAKLPDLATRNSNKKTGAKSG